VTDFERLLRVLTQADVEFIVIGGFAATAHGSAHVTVDLDVVYRRTPANIDRLVHALELLEPYLRGAPPGLPFRWDGDTIRQGLNFTLTTRAGDLDLLGEATGGGTYEALLPHSERREVGALDCRFVNLETLIRLKRAAGRPKDLERIAELEALRQEAARQDPRR
jgi:predicted nucleotidyltransferase